jgi:predicted AAA+ superfamily ATPase
MRQSLVKVFTGQRRVGKSYLLYQVMQQVLAEDASAHIIYINKEDLAFDDILDAGQLYQYVSERLQPDGFNYIFIDEIQEIKDFEKAVRSLLLNPQNDLYITGSNAKLLSGELATLLSGRTIEIEVHSLSYPEFLQFHALPNDSKALDLYLRYGGLPYLRNLSLTDGIVFDYLKNIYTSILYRDVVARYNIRSMQFLEKLVQFFADSTGSIFSAKSISDFLKAQKTNISHTQVQAFAGYLANAFLIHSVPRYDIKGKRLFETGEKYYFENLGIRNAIIGYRTADLGKLA